MEEDKRQKTESEIMNELMSELKDKLVEHDLEFMGFLASKKPDGAVAILCHGSPFNLGMSFQSAKEQNHAFAGIIKSSELIAEAFKDSK